MESKLKVETKKTADFPPFDLLHTKLNGQNLIEASAGTGKTFAITRIFIRLLLENEIPISSILVVTFTESATYELRERIYLLLKEALTAFNTGLTDDPLLKHLLCTLSKANAQVILKRAISNFDSCAIYTIHGFCQRVISDNTFESESTFGSTIITDQNDLIKEAAADFWRNNFYCNSSMFISYALQSKISLETFIELFNKAKNFNEIKTIPEIAFVDFIDSEQLLSLLFEQLKSEWWAKKEDIKKLLSSKTLKAIKYSDKIIMEITILMEKFCKNDNFNPLLFKHFANFSTSTIVHNTKKNEPVIKHNFFDICENIARNTEVLTQKYNTYLDNLKIQSLNYINKQITIQKEAQNVLYFDDLLKNVHKALINNTNGMKFAKFLAGKYQAALIDEFQDTDLIQYSIFKQIFLNNNIITFFIGDPKQAIYSFRGADVFTYLKAAQQVTFKYSLNINYRTHPELVSAISFIFSVSDNPFLNKQIRFTESNSGVSDQQAIIINGVRQKPLRIWLTKGENAQTISIHDAIANEIARLIDPKENYNLIGSKPINASHFAILVRTNSEALIFQESLSRHGITSVIDSNSSVFTTIEAQEMYHLLRAVAEPTDNQLINAALTLPFFSLCSKDINQCIEDDERYNYYLDLFSNHHFMWIHEGFDIMISSFFNQIKIHENILSFPVGERKLTNYLHIKELISRESIKSHQRSSSLINWLSEKIKSSSNNISDDEIIRLESDDDSVKIITIHKSKGLEYDIVFCPSIGVARSDQSANDAYIFHNQDDNPVLVIGKNEQEEFKNYLESETLAENLRLLYVALTRAKSGCYLIYNDSENAMSSPLSYLLFGKNITFPQVALLKNKLKSLQNQEIWRLLEEITHKHPYISSEIIVNKNAKVVINNSCAIEHLSCRTLSNQIPETWKIASYSSLAHSYFSTEIKFDEFLSEKPDRAAANEPIKEFTMFNFPKGAKAGTLLHDLLEDVDLSNIQENTLTSLISEKLKISGFDADWNEILLDLVKTISQVRLNSEKAEFSLSEINLQNCIKEMAFFFPLKCITPLDLQNIFSSLQTDLFGNDYTCEELQFSPVHGFMKGFIDLIFAYKGKYYILDWKSNYLGAQYQDYQRESLTETMKNEHYYLQYYFYSVALHQYLKLYLASYSYAEHFGGVFYLFLRGLSLTSKTGIFFDKPEQVVVENLASVLIQENQKHV